jgi:hypothetical protein
VEIQIRDTVPFMDVGPDMVGIRQFDSSLVGITEGPSPDRTSSKPFIVKIQTGKEYESNCRIPTISGPTSMKGTVSLI